MADSTGPQPIGYRADGSPIYLPAGAADIVVDDGDDDEPDPTDRHRAPAGDDDDDDDEPDDDQADGDDDDDYQPPSKDQWERLQRRLRAANKQAANRKRWLQGIGVDPHSGKRLADGGDDNEPAETALADPAAEPTTDPAADQGETAPARPAAEAIRRAEDRAAARAAASADATYRPIIAALAAENALRAADWSGGDIGMVLRLIDPDQIEVDLDSGVSGIDDQIEQIKAEFPMWFRRNGGGGRSGAADVDGVEPASARRSRRPAKPKTWAEKIVASWTGGR